MNLDHNDDIIKRRLAQKMQFLSDDIASLKEPTEDELQEYYKDHVNKYLTPTSYSLYQIIFSADKRTDNKKDAVETLKQFPNANFDEMKNWGDQLPFSYYFEDVTTNELGLQLGSKFSDGLKGQEMNKWIGPIPSGFGYHLVYITKRFESCLPDFEARRKDVIRDFEYDKQEEVNTQIYKELKKRYDVEINIRSEDFDPEFVDYLEKEMNE